MTKKNKKNIKKKRDTGITFQKIAKLTSKSIGKAYVNYKKKQKIKEIFISPIFKHKNKSPLGIHKLKYIFEDTEFEKIALGGINYKNIKLLKLSNFIGIAGIRIFKKKGPK